MAIRFPRSTGDRLRLVRGWSAGAAIAIAAIAGGPSAAEVPAAQRVAAWVLASGDSKGEPFAIVDKIGAQLFVFDADGTPHGTTPVLLGLARGDLSVPGIGDRPLAKILPAERTTPAGRFDAEFGTNTAGHRILWIDYDAAISLHAVVTANPRERRLERLATPDTSDNRISFGCINVPKAFFTQTIEPVFGPRGGVVYILPDERSIEAVFGIASRTAP